MEADPGQHRLGRLVVRQAGGLEPVQAQIVEDEGQHGAQRLRHQTLAGMGLPHPVTDRRGLGDTAAHVAEIDAAHQLAALVEEDEQAVGLARPPFARLLAQPPAEMVSAQGIVGPGRLPRCEKVAAAGAQFSPFRPILHGRGAQIDAPPVDTGHSRQGEGYVGETEHLLL